MNTTRTLTTEQELEISTRYRKGETADQLAAAFDVARRTVYNILHRGDTKRTRAHHSLTEGQEKEIAERYSRGESVRNISRDFSVHLQTIHNMLKKRGLNDPARAKTPASSDQREAIVAACKEGANAETVALRFGVSPKSVFRYLRSAGVRLPKGRPRVYDINDSSFDLLSAQSLYWTGFIHSDGHITNTNRLIVCLASKDVEHLEKLRSFVGSTHPIRETKSVSSFNKNSTFVWFSPHSKRICEVLRARGIVIKRQRVPSPELVASPHFWRGTIDGDGCLGIGDFDGRLYPYIQLAGQIPLLEAFREFLIKNNLPALTPHQCDTGNVPVISTSGSTARDIIALLYRDAPIALDRKLERAKLIIAGVINEKTLYAEDISSVSFDETDIPTEILADDDDVDDE